MAFSSNNYQQLGLGDRSLSLGDREREMIQNSWAGAFADRIFPRIEEKLFARLYSRDSTSPSSPVNVTVGLMILEEIFGQHEQDAVNSLICDVRYQTALHTTSAVVQPVSVRTLQRFRKRVADYRAETGTDLITQCIDGSHGELDAYLQQYFPEKELDYRAIGAGITRNRSVSGFDPSIIDDPERFKENTLPAHSDHIAYASRQEMEADPDGEGITSLRCSLNGLWKFSYANNPQSAVRGFEKTSYDCSGWDDIRVPAHLQMEGYDAPSYCNYEYPWDGREEVEEGKTPVRFNPVGSYVKYFTVPKAWQNRPVFLSLQGVESGYALWLNGTYVGYSEDTFTPSEFDLTPYLTREVNKLAIRVFKWTSSSWLEDQDFYRFSGIFRDVYLYTIPEVHLYDLKIRTLLDDSYENAVLELSMDLMTGTVNNGSDHEGTQNVPARTGEAGISPDGPAADAPARESSRHRFGYTDYQLVRNGRVILSGEIDNMQHNEVRETAAAPELWSAENPALYDLYLTLHAKSGAACEFIHEKIGFRRFEMKNGLMCLNGRRIVFNGVNRHEFNCDTGRAGMTRDMVTRDLITMKRNNINAIRTCHYPDDSRLYRLCDEFGLYLIAENNMETHGTWALSEAGITPKDAIIPGDKKEWQDVLLDRVNSCYQRDKNHPAILIWSCGNESSGGSVIYEMSRLFHRLDPDRLVHYEGIFHDRTYNVTSDMESQMYPSVKAIREFLAANQEKPFLCCEYSHSMGNSNGGMGLYTDLAEEEPRYQGGFIWDFVDQSLRKRDRYGVEYQAYGGDCLERPTDYSFSGNGIVAGDRKDYPKLQEVKFNYQNVRIRVDKDRCIVKNLHLFTPLTAFDSFEVLSRNGIRLQEVPVDIGTAPLSEEEIRLPVPVPDEEGEYTVVISVRLKEKTPYADAGYEIAFGQGIFRVEKHSGTVAGPAQAGANPAAAAAQLRESVERGQLTAAAGAAARELHIIRGVYNVGAAGRNFDALISFLNGGQLTGGGLTSYRYGGKELIAVTPRLNFWRALTDNDKGNQLGARYGQWKLASLYQHILPAEPDPAAKTQEYPKIAAHRDRVDVTMKVFLNTVPQSTCLVTYSLGADGSVGFALDYTPVPGLAPMPEFGMLFHLDADYDQVEYYGNGPEETYCDRDRGAKLGIYRTTASGSMTRYLVPQECGNHTGVRWAKVTDRRGRGLLFAAKEGTDMNFSALPYTPDEIENAMHHTELPPVHYTIVRVSLQQMGVGGDDSWGARTHDEDLLPNDRPLHFEFTMRGV